MKEVWEVLEIMLKVVGWYLTGIISIGAFNALWEPRFNLYNLRKTAMKLLLLALLGPFILLITIGYILYHLAILSFHREWDLIPPAAEYILLGFRYLPHVEKEEKDSSPDFPTVSP